MLDSVTLAVLKGRLEQIADEMDATLFRAAFSPIIAEAHDAAHGLYHPETGETMVQGKSGLPIFVGVMSFAVRAVIEKFGNTLKDGDVVIFNDPYLGGTHVSDMRLVRPYFRDGRLLCYLGSVAHWHDIGGPVPGNYNPKATEIWQEGVLIPPMRLYAAGELREDVVDLLCANSRLPRSAYGDLMGQVQALGVGARRLDDLVAEYGGAVVADSFLALKARASRQMRSLIAELPDGTYTVEDHLDNDGGEDIALKIALDLTISGETMRLDFSRSAAPCAGPLGIAYATSASACYVALKHIFNDVPANSGVLEPISVVIPDTTMLNVGPPHPTGGYTETIMRIIDLLFVVFAQFAPHRCNAMAYGATNSLALSGRRGGREGPFWILFSFFGGGHPGNPLRDGLNHGNAPVSTATIPPVEIFEAQTPVLFRQWALRPDSGGAGRHRGGLGAIYEIEILEPGGADVTLSGERARHPPQGVLGGGPAAPTRFYWHGPDGGWCDPPLGSKVAGVKIRQGQRVRLETPGGGGYGPPAERDPAAIARDVALGYVSPERAAADYGVALPAQAASRAQEKAR
ncbi:MAG: hydantoinase B/oxoprolinase family protein [Alphaproteobacteria bacterium]|nr:hydantoinase B/oxoprolinase family protein [Alphaproteobacteria bacterium]